MAENTVPAKVENRSLETRDESRYLVPPVDIYETGKNLVVVADLPGVDKDGLSIRVEDDILTINGKPHDGLPGDAIGTEFELLDFYRQFRLGEEVDRQKITADLKHGVLTIVLPKVEKAQPREIDVRVA